VIPQLAVLAALAALWQALAMLSGGIATPAASVARAATLLATPAFWADAATTGQAFALSALLSIAGGLAVAAAIGRTPLAVAVLEPVLVNLYALPKVTLYPLVLLLFGLGIRAKVAFGVMHGLLPLALFTLGAIVNIPPVLLRTAAVLHLSPGQTLCRVVLPAILPEVLAGVRLAVSLSLLGVLIGEMFASSSGLGHRAMAAMENGDMAAVLAEALLLAAFAVALNTALLAAARPWAPR
jgi:NitT/TauT family transport system permease protein